MLWVNFKVAEVGPKTLISPKEKVIHSMKFKIKIFCEIQVQVSRSICYAHISEANHFTTE